jgi:two-component system repressor protein LuxO
MHGANILLVEDSRALAQAYVEFLRPDGHKTTHVEKGAEALIWLRQNNPDIILLDLMLPDMNGMDVLRTLKKQENQAEILIITAHGSVDIAVEALREGATDFLEKPFDSGRLRTTLQNILEKRRLADEVKTYRQVFKRSHYHGFIGGSLVMQSVYRIIDSAASSKAAVFITGESGTGKEVCAEAIHSQSPRSDRPFVALNCAAIPKDLMESEVFGHVRGAFTGAHSDREGAASMANGGTLFLDEICEMDSDIQSKLLRFIQTGTIQKVGDAKPEKVDIRIVCATNRDPMEEVEQGRFREDLYYRLHVIPIHLPPLSERGEDILEIASQLAEKFAEEEGKSLSSFDDGMEKWLLNQTWPGNVRQLQNVLRNIIVLNDGDLITESMLPKESRRKMPLPLSPAPSSGSKKSIESSQNNQVAFNEIMPLWHVEQLAIQSAIDRFEGNVPRAAAALEVSASTLYRKIQRWEKPEIID